MTVLTRAGGSRRRKIKRRTEYKRKNSAVSDRRFTDRRFSYRPLMEAQGIEPWSESTSGTASTCVGLASSLASGRRKAILPDVDLLSCTLLTSEDRQSLVRIDDSHADAPDGLRSQEVQ